MKEIVRIRFGSHLYGTSTPASDEDWKGLFVPETRDVLLGRIPKTAEAEKGSDGVKNAPGEMDRENYSLHHFIKLAVQGQTVALDMLYAPNEMTMPGSYYWIWSELQREKSRFLSKSMNAFVGYARAQAAKYSLKGERLEKLQDFVGSLSGACREVRLETYWNRLPKDDEREGPHCKELQIGGKWFGETTAVGLVIDAVERQIARYGKRANAAAGSGGIDWKALSHAVRVALELEDLLTKGEIEFPLIYAPYLTNIKTGELSLESVQDRLDTTLERIESLSSASSLPEKVDAKWWDDWLAAIMAAEVHTDVRP